MKKLIPLVLLFLCFTIGCQNPSYIPTPVPPQLRTLYWVDAFQYQNHKVWVYEAIPFKSGLLITVCLQSEEGNSFATILHSPGKAPVLYNPQLNTVTGEIRKKFYPIIQLIVDRLKAGIQTPN